MRPITFKQAQARFCPEAQLWARQQPNLTTAWRTCHVGAWMAWWLYDFRRVDLRTSYQNADYAGVVGRIFTVNSSSPEQQLRYANYLRAHYHANGIPRKVKHE